MKLNLRQYLALLLKNVTKSMDLNSILNGTEVRSPAQLYELIQAMVTSGQWTMANIIRLNVSIIVLGIPLGFIGILSPMLFPGNWKTVFFIVFSLTSFGVLYLVVRFIQQASKAQQKSLFFLFLGLIPMLLGLGPLYRNMDLPTWQLAIILWGFSLTYAIMTLRFAPRYAISFSKLINGGRLWLGLGNANSKVDLTNRLAFWLLTVAPDYSGNRNRNGLTAQEIQTIQAMAAVEQGGVDWRGVLFNLLALVGVPIGLIKLPEANLLGPLFSIFSTISGRDTVVLNFYIAALLIFALVWLTQVADFLSYLVFSEPANRTLQLACIQALDALSVQQADSANNEKQLRERIASWGYRAEFTADHKSRPPEGFTVVSVWSDYRRPGQFVRLMRRNISDYF